MGKVVQLKPLKEENKLWEDPEIQYDTIYNPELAFQLKQHDIEIWPGLYYSV